MKVAVIDIGSNAIRAVIYVGENLGATQIYSEKFRVDLRSLLSEGEFTELQEIHLVIKYFLRIIAKFSVSKIIAVATAVLRDHSRSEDWVRFIYNTYNLEVEIISGEREAYLSAYGVLHGSPNPNGIIADLGGGSLEIAEICNRNIISNISLSLGTNILEKNIFSFNQICELIQVKINAKNSKTLLLTGGIFRILFFNYMKYSNYQLKNLHNFQVHVKENLNKYLDMFKSDISAESNAVLVLRSLIYVLNPEKIIISRYGLKEGIFYNSLSIDQKLGSIVLEITRNTLNSKYSKEVLDKYKMIIKHILLHHDKEVLEVIEIVIMLVGKLRNIDSLSASQFAVNFILTSDIPFSHRQRLMITVAISYVFYYKLSINIKSLSMSLLKPKDFGNSLIIGHAIKIYQILDGAEFILPDSYFDIDKNNNVVVENAINIPSSIMSKVNKVLANINYTRHKYNARASN